MQTRSIETRAKILKSAQELFSRSGYESASVADICAAAGISKGAFYHHFPSKQVVFLSLLDDWLKGIDGGLEILRGDQPDPKLALVQMMEILPTVLKAAEGRLPIFLEFWAHSARDEALWKQTTAPFKKYQEYFSRMMADETAAEGGDPHGRQTAAYAVLALAIGMLFQGIVDTEERDWKRIGQDSMRLLTQGMTRRS
jgi:AcrR family transcriptional regulator